MIKLTEEKRVKWDIFVFIVILIATFEIPYDLLVGHSSIHTEHLFNYLFYIVFGLDIILNCITSHKKRYSGLFGWRNIAGLFYDKLSPDSIKKKKNVRFDITIEKQPDMLLSYLTSGWFIIDFLAVFPFQTLLGGFGYFNMSRTLRLARIPRLIRILRVLRTLKSVRIFRTFEKIFSRYPSLVRFLIILLLVPWTAHVFACLLDFFESSYVGNANPTITSYASAWHHIFVSFTTNSLADVVSQGGKIFSIVTVVFGYIFFGMFMGNFVSLFGEIDKNKLIFEEKRKNWDNLLNEYPKVFTKELRKNIHDNLDKETIYLRIDEHYKLIKSLDSELEGKIKAEIKRVLRENPHDEKLKNLSKKWSFFID